jgi:peptide subunit release factor 1 (eRF1)
MNALSHLSLCRSQQSCLVSLFVPASASSMSSYGQLLAAELTTANNIKDKTNRNNVISALKALQERVRLHRTVPENGIALYAGQCV